jgi:signal transduction histidine kinase
VSSAVTSLRLFATRPRSGLFVDGAIAIAALLGSLALLRHGGIGPVRPGSGDLDLIGVVLAACSTLPIAGWRRSPLGVFVATAAAGVVLAGLGYRIDLLLGPAVALYLVAASRAPEAPWTERSTATVVALFVLYLGATAAAQNAVPESEFLHTGLAWAVAWFAGERTRLRREQLAELRARAVRAEGEAEQDRLLAVAEERARIARDLHDSAGHAINVIAVRAGAARLRHHEDPDRSLAALQAIEDVARQTAAEIDQIVSTLRKRGSADGAVEAPNGLASLETLVERHRESGLEVTADTSGIPRRLGAPADQAAYRILQEALTNAARHGTGSARVAVSFDEEAVQLTVTNPLPANPVNASTRGHGLIGMRERAKLLGGNLETERANGVFRVDARIPYSGQPA